MTWNEKFSYLNTDPHIYAIRSISFIMNLTLYTKENNNL